MMKNNEKLKLVFDFIADYLTEENQEPKEVTDDNVVIEKKGEDTLKRAYTIMKKMEDIDKVNANVNSRVREVVNPIMEELKKVKSEYTDKTIESERNGNRSGLTIDDEGSVVEISVPPLAPEMSEEGPAPHNED